MMNTMGTNERLRASFASYSHALRRLTLLLRESTSMEGHSCLIIEQAAQAHLNTILFRRFFQHVAPDLVTPDLSRKIEELNAPPREICEILNDSGRPLSTFQWEGGEMPLEDFALVAATSPTQNSTGAYFTPPPLASQMSHEIIANWLWALIPEVLRARFSPDIQDAIVKQNCLMGMQAKAFFAQLPTVCQGNPIMLMEELSLGVGSCKILDPACGSGTFLVEIAKILFAVSQHFFPRTGGSGFNNRLAREILTKNLFGIDLVPEYVRVARVLIFCTLLPHLCAEDILPCFAGLCEHIQSGNFLLSPFQERLNHPVPSALHARILIEIATCFLDVMANNIAWAADQGGDIEKYARGPIDAIPSAVWRRIAMYLGIPTSDEHQGDLCEIILQLLNPPLKMVAPYDIILGNPPQEGARKETGRQQPTSWTTRVQRLCIKYLQKSQLFADLQEAWDFSLPFIIRAMEVLAPKGWFAFILPRSIGTQTFARKVLTKILPKIRRVVYFNLSPNAVFETWDPTRQELLPAGNDFLVLSCVNAPMDLPRYEVQEVSPFDYTGPPSVSETRQGADVPRFLAQPPNMPTLQGIPLKFFVTITKGATLCARAEWRRTRGSFKTRDLVSATRDANHPLRFVEPAHIGPFCIAGESFLEYHHAQYPDRVPTNIHRWREDAFFHGPLLVTPLSKRVPSIALIPADFEAGSWRSPETVVLFKRWVDWFREFPEKLPPAIERMKMEAITALEHGGTPANASPSAGGMKLLEQYSGTIPLEVLALVLSSPAVHELRLKGGKSFGKFEAGDWENVPLPLLTADEVAMLLDDYRAIRQTLLQAQDQCAQSGICGRDFKALVEKTLFKGKSRSKLKQADLAASADFSLLQSRWERSSKVIAAAYSRMSPHLTSKKKVGIAPI